MLPTPLTTVLRDHVAPRPGDTTLEMLRRAEMGVRVVGATCAAVLASDPNPRAGVAAAVRQWLERTGMFGLGRTIRVVLSHLENRESPIAGWAGLLEGRVDRRSCRPIDRWLTDYESTLRHAGRNPPPDTMTALDAAFHTQLGELLEQLETLGGASISIAGQDTSTTVAGVPAWPLLVRRTDRVGVWDRRQGKRRGRWLDLHSRASWFEPIDPDGLGILTALERASGDETLEAFCQEGGVSSRVDEANRPHVHVADQAPLGDVMDGLVRLHGAADRPVVTALIDDSTTLLEALSDAVTPGEPQRLFASLSRWQEKTGQTPILVVASERLDGRELRALFDELGGSAHLWGITRRHTLRRWEPESRRAVRIERYPEDPEPAEPASVGARRAAGTSEIDAWTQAARERFSLVGPAALNTMLSILAGATPLVGSEEALRWWGRGDIAVRPDGVPTPTHPGWRAFVAGLRGEVVADRSSPPCRAGRRLAVELRGSGS